MSDRQPTGAWMKNALFTIAVTLMFALGIYSLILAYATTGEVQQLTTRNLLRTATANDNEQIALARGSLIDVDLVYVVVDDPQLGSDPDVDIAARQATQALVDSGLVVSVRRLEPSDPDFSTIVTQNSVDRFPAVLVVKRDGGIVLVTDDFSTENLLHVYHTVWGKTSDCGAARNAVY